MLYREFGYSNGLFGFLYLKKDERNYLQTINALLFILLSTITMPYAMPKSL